MRSNFQMLLDRILWYLFRRQYVITFFSDDVTIMSSLRSDM